MTSTRHITIWRALKYISLTLGIASFAIMWAMAVTAAAYKPAHYRAAMKICVKHGGNYTMPLMGLPRELKGWRCYYVVDDVAEPDWIGPDILARRYLPYEKKTGWKVWEDAS